MGRKTSPLIWQEWLAFKAAIQFLTRIPVGELTFDAEVFGRSLRWYPVAGLVLGVLLQALLIALPDQTHALFNGVLILTAWVLLTGALHLDGLADVADAWVGGMGDRQRTLDIMKDPNTGAMAVVVLIVVLLLKLVALTVLLQNFFSAIWAVPVVARALVLAAFATTPYIRQQGLGSALCGQSPFVTGGILLLTSGLLWVLMPLELWLAWLVAAGGVFWLWRRAMLYRLQGFTGDGVGALVELAEVILLVTSVLIFV